MNYGLNLESPEDLEDLSAKYNIFYAIFGGAGAIFGLISGGTFSAILIFGAFGLVIGYAIKASILKSAKYKFRTMDFYLPEELDLEKIISVTSQLLQPRGITVALENGELTFKHGSIEYEFIPDNEKKTFRLRWTFSVARAIFGAREIGDYKALRDDTGLIAYTIQKINK